MKSIVITLAFVGAVAVSSVSGFLLGREAGPDLGEHSDSLGAMDVSLTDLELSEDERVIVSGYLRAELQQLRKGRSRASRSVILASSDEYYSRCGVSRFRPDFCIGFERAMFQATKAKESMETQKNLEVIRRQGSLFAVL